MKVSANYYTFCMEAALLLQWLLKQNRMELNRKFYSIISIFYPGALLYSALNPKTLNLGMLTLNLNFD